MDLQRYKMDRHQFLGNGQGILVEFPFAVILFSLLRGPFKFSMGLVFLLPLRRETQLQRIELS